MNEEERRRRKRTRQLARCLENLRDDHLRLRERLGFAASGLKSLALIIRHACRYRAAMADLPVWLESADELCGSISSDLEDTLE